MQWRIVEVQEKEETKRHAGGKAREDIDSVLEKLSFGRIEIIAPQSERDNASILKKISLHRLVASRWKQALASVNKGDVVFFQFPVINHTFFMKSILKELKKTGVKTICLIHDLEMLRIGNNKEYSYFNRLRVNKEELGELLIFDKIIVHNESMKRLLNERYHIDNDKMITIEIFDYLLEKDIEFAKRKNSGENICIIAGNLSKEKSAYAYMLPPKPDFALYGINYSADKRENIVYHGSFLANELPNHLEGKYGLIWDGDSIETCQGVWGEYLKINNPHKTSLYLACGFPVIVWTEAAIACFVRKEGLGFTISSITELQDKLNDISESQYNQYCANVKRIAKRLQTGFYTQGAVCSAMKGL